MEVLYIASKEKDLFINEKIRARESNGDWAKWRKLGVKPLTMH